MTQYIGPSPDYSSTSNRYLYALRRDDEGTLYIARLDSKDSTDSIDLVNGILPESLSGLVDLDSGEYFEGRSSTTKELVSETLNYEQWRWENKFISYYINADGEFVALVGEDRTYPTDV